MTGIVLLLKFKGQRYSYGLGLLGEVFVQIIILALFEQIF